MEIKTENFFRDGVSRDPLLKNNQKAQEKTFDIIRFLFDSGLVNSISRFFYGAWGVLLQKAKYNYIEEQRRKLGITLK